MSYLLEVGVGLILGGFAALALLGDAVLVLCGMLDVEMDHFFQ